MKQITPYLLTALVLLLVACNSNQQEPISKKRHSPFRFYPTDSIQIDTDSLKIVGEMIPLDTAQKWIANYQDFMSTLYRKNSSGEMVPLGESEILNGFTYRTEDILSVLGIPKNKLPINVPHIRGYFGMTNTNGSFTYKLLLLAAVNASLDPKQGATSAGKDAFFTAKRNNSLKLNDENEGFVLDLNYPCPTLCPDSGNNIRNY